LFGALYMYIFGGSMARKSEKNHSLANEDISQSFNFSCCKIRSGNYGVSR
jgi:hypothetical protein